MLHVLTASMTMDPRPQLAFLSDPLAPECDVEPESKPNSIHVSGSKRFSGAWCTHGHKKEEKEVARQPKRPTDGAYMVHPSPASPSVDRFCALVAAIWADKAKQSSFEPVEGLRGSRKRRRFCSELDGQESASREDQAPCRLSPRVQLRHELLQLPRGHHLHLVAQERQDLSAMAER